MNCNANANFSVPNIPSYYPKKNNAILTLIFLDNNSLVLTAQQQIFILLFFHFEHTVTPRNEPFCTAYSTT